MSDLFLRLRLLSLSPCLRFKLLKQVLLQLEKDITCVVHEGELSVHLRVDSNDDHMILAHGYVSDLVLTKLVCPSEGISGRDFLFSVARSRQVEKLGHLVIYILYMVA